MHARAILVRHLQKGLLRIQQSMKDRLASLALFVCLKFSASAAAPENIAELKARAEKGDAMAQVDLANRYYSGEGVPRDMAETERWFRKATPELKAKAERGDASAQHWLGVFHATGMGGVAKDYAEALKWFRKSAAQGDAGAKYRLGILYSNGNGVPKDDAEAVRWWHESAEQGNAEAQYFLAYSCWKGEGIGKDLVQSHAWYSICILTRPNHQKARELRSKVESGMDPIQIAEATKLAREFEAKIRGVKAERR